MTTLRVLVLGLWATLRVGSKILWTSRRRPDRLRCVCRTAPRDWSGAILRAARVDVVVEGVEHLAGGRPAVLVANHESWFDVFALATYLPVDYRFVAKKELASIPLFGPSWKACGHISIDRSDRSSAIQSLDEARRRVRDEGGVVIMFPEGTRSRSERMLPFKKGAFVLALQLGVPVIPVGISGSRAVMAPGRWRIRPGTIRIRIGEPLPVEGLEDRGRDDLLRRARDDVERLRAPASHEVADGLRDHDDMEPEP